MKNRGNLFRCYGKTFKIKVCKKIGFLGLDFKIVYLDDPIAFTDCKIAQDYCMYVTSPATKDYIFNTFKIWQIHTTYDAKIKKLNKVFKKYCKQNNEKYYPYELVIKWENNSFCYKLNNPFFYELTNKNSLKTLVNSFETYVYNLLSNKVVIRSTARKDMAKMDKVRNKLIDDEIERLYNNIKFLNKLKR